MIGILIVMLIVFVVIRKAKKRGYDGIGNSAKVHSNRQPTRNAARTKDLRTYKRTSPKEAPDKSLKDDIGNDWLARQLREEHEAFKRTSEMFNLKIEHASHCDARLIKKQHYANCDADAVDTGSAH